MNNIAALIFAEIFLFILGLGIIMITYPHLLLVDALVGAFIIYIFSAIVSLVAGALFKWMWVAVSARKGLNNE